MAQSRNRKKPASISNTLLQWFDAHGRDLPWRVRAIPMADPYGVWLSEVMLQQTTVAAVGPYYKKFIRRWPTVEKLASASEADVLHAWAGLGYYARGRNLLKCARIIAGDRQGKFPGTESELKKLPGIGDYTAAAIAAISFGQPATVVDGNVERVASRLFAIATPLPKSKARIKREVGRLVPPSRPGDFAQAMMDLGATICLARNPRCFSCPLQNICIAYGKGAAESYPRRMAKPKRPTRYGAAYWIECDQQVLLRRRPSTGLLGGMPEFPTGPWLENRAEKGGAPMELAWLLLPGEVHHTFTHFHLVLEIYRAQLRAKPETLKGYWVARDKIMEAGLPSLMKKVARMVTA